MISIRKERPSDVAAREALLDVAYGDARFGKPSERLRDGRSPAAGLSFVAIETGRVIGTVRLWDVVARSGHPALLLGPLAVHPDCRNRGIGSGLMRRALAAAARRGHGAVLLVGDASYYARFGFSAKRTGSPWLPGLNERHRLLGLELESRSLVEARSVIHAPHRPSAFVADRIATAAAALRPIASHAA